jgi:RNA-binding protein Musashi
LIHFYKRGFGISFIFKEKKIIATAKDFKKVLKTSMTGEVKNNTETNEDYEYDMTDKAKRVATNVHEDERKLFVGGLPNEAKHEDIKQHFSTFGKVEKVKLMSDQVTGRFKGFGFVVFEEVGGYNAAMAKAEQVILGRTVTVKRATVKVKQGKIYIGKLPIEGISVDDIRTHFSQFGTVLEVVRPVDKAKDDEPKSFAFVTFAREETARQLVKLGGDVMNGHKFNIKPVITKDPVQAGGRPGPPMPGQHAPQHGQGPPSWGGHQAAAQQAYVGGYGAAAQGYGQQQAAYANYANYSQAGYGTSQAGYAGQQAAAASYYGAAANVPPPPPAPVTGAGVPSLATFNPYDMASYGNGGGGKMRATPPGQGQQARAQPY